jgi:hypothetical protein
MPSSNGKLRTEDIGVLFFIAAFIFGAWFRIFVPYNSGFPINDGGLYYCLNFSENRISSSVRGAFDWITLKTPTKQPNSVSLLYGFGV